MKYYTNKKYLGWAIGFWSGVGLMSIINIWKIDYDGHPVSYSWIMFGVSIVFIIVCLILVKVKEKE